MQQLKIDFSAPKIPVEDEKKTELISFRVGEKFKADLDVIAKAKNIDLSKLCQEYMLKGFMEDYKTILLIEFNGNRTLRDFLAKG